MSSSSVIFISPDWRIIEQTSIIEAVQTIDMKVIQGRYAEKIESKKGKLKGLRIATDGGSETVYLHKALRAIALEELTLNDPVRLWVDDEDNYALQLIPLAPKTALDRAIAQTDFEETVADKPTKPTGQKKAGQKKAGQRRKKVKAKKSKMTVQVCQKKNCCKKGGDDLWEAFEAVSAQHKFKLEPIGCLGGCKRGPNIRMLPDNVKYRHVQPAEIDGILQTHSG